MIKNEVERLNLPLQLLQQMMTKVFMLEQVSQKIRAKKESFLLRLPLFSLIYQKKGEANFKVITQHIRMVKQDFGSIVFDSDENRSFNYILKGTVMLFSRTVTQDKKAAPKLFKKLAAGQHFGEKMQFGKQQLQSARCVSLSYLLQLDIKAFYFCFAGHFQCQELRDQVTFVKEVWLFNSISRATLEKVLVSSQHKQFVRGTVLFRQNEAATHLFLIFDGEITLETQEQGRTRPFCVLSRSQIYGSQEMFQGRSYDASGVCTSDYCDLLIIPRQVVEKYVEKDKFPAMIQRRKKLSIELKHNSSNERCQQSVNALREQANRAGTNPIRRYSQYERRVKTETDLKSTTLSKIEILNELFQREVQLKHEELRRYRLEHIRNTQNGSLYSTKRISSYVNKDCTYDKEMILKYLERKERMYHCALRKELEYQSRKVVFVPELRVERSPAVKNHKRKLKNSRRNNFSLSLL